MRVDKENMADAERRIRDFIKNVDRLPNTVTMKSMDTGSKVPVPIYQACGMFYNNYMFWLKQGRFPNYVTSLLNKNEPTILNYQDNKYNCCPASISMISTKLFKPMSEAYCANILGTGTDGTPPKRLMANINKLGLGISRMTRNATNVNNALNKYNGVLCHYETKAAPCSGFHNNYGHYAVIKEITRNGEYLMYDPTRGEFKCKFGTMDNATNGRELFYYAIDLL